MNRVTTTISLATWGRPAPSLPSTCKGFCLVSTATKAQHKYKLERSSCSGRRTAGPPVRFCSSCVFVCVCFFVCLFLTITTQPNPNPATPGYPKATRVRLPRVLSVKASWCRPRSQVHAVCVPRLLCICCRNSRVLQRDGNQIVLLVIT